MSCLLLGVASTCLAQLDTGSIDIVRDQWGVPHIFAPTDEQVAYGLAWACSEDQFSDMQESFLAVRGKLSEVKGRDGAIMDIAAHFIGLKELMDTAYAEAFSPKFEAVLTAYVTAVNRYAELHPNEVLRKGVFPISNKDLIAGYTLGLTFMTGVQYELLKIFKNRMLTTPKQDYFPEGSNAYAFNSNKMEDGSQVLIGNSHQPLNGPYAWYEAHVCSKEGWNMLGGTFPGGLCIFIGVNENLGWAHTVNFPDLVDVYRLDMHPKKKNQYRFDGEWLDLQVRKVKLKVKVLGSLRLPITQTYYWSKHGPVIKNKEGYWALRFPANMRITAAEQWYHMNKATDYQSWKKALEVQGHPGLNVIYADKEDNIAMVGNGLFPKDRDRNLEWKNVIIRGDTSSLIWSPEYFPIDSLVKYENPDCGWLYNCNNSPFSATCQANDAVYSDYNPTLGYMIGQTNRAKRTTELMDGTGLMSYEEIKKMKYDRSYASCVEHPTIEDLETVFQVDPQTYPELKEVMKLINDWDRVASLDSRAAGFMSVAVKYIEDHVRDGALVPGPVALGEQAYAAALLKAKKYVRKHYGRVDVPLSEIQRHVRGEVDLPCAGLPDVLAATYVNFGKGEHKGKMIVKSGESYICLARWKDGKQYIETVNCYGASSHEDSPHYSDQMEMFTNQQLKPMTLNKDSIYKHAERIYHPR